MLPPCVPFEVVDVLLSSVAGTAYTTNPKPNRNIIAKNARMFDPALAGSMLLQSLFPSTPYNGWLPGSGFLKGFHDLTWALRKNCREISQDF